MIQFVSVSRFFEDFPAIEDVSFTVEDGEMVLLTGHSGSGKTTLIKMLIREIQPTAGKIFVDGEDINRLWRWGLSRLRRKTGVVFQDFKLLEDKNVFENIAFALEISGKNNKEINQIVPYVLDIVGLSDKIYAFPHELSGGQKQRVAIARAISNDPKILIADEPTGNLDEENTWEIVKVLQKINEWGTTVLMVTHSKEIIERLNIRTLVFEKGKIVEDTKGSQTKIAQEFAERMIEAHDIPDQPEPPIKETPEIETQKDSEDVKVSENNEKEKDKTSEKIETKEIEAKPQQTEETPEIPTEQKKPKLKIGLSSKHKKNKSENIEPPVAKVTNPEFEKLGLSHSVIKLLEANNYKTIQDVITAGMDHIKLIDEIDGDQIDELEKTIAKFLDQSKA